MKHGSNVVWKTVLALFALIGVSAPLKSTEGWKPRMRPDRAFSQEWQFAGCESGAIDFSCWAGSLPGYLCTWRRPLDRAVLVREERYTSSGQFHLAYEKTDDGAEAYRLIFFDKGRSYFRLSEGPGRDGLYHADVVVRGLVTSRYASAWDRIIADSNGELASIPMDTRLLVGEPFLPIEAFHTRRDEEAVLAIRRDGVDLSSPRPIEFGFWFADDHRPAAIERLAELGCRWRSAEERGGTIGPYPGHCLMTTRVDAANLADWHRRFVSFASDKGGRYYGWTGKS